MATIGLFGMFFLLVVGFQSIPAVMLFGALLKEMLNKKEK